MAIYIDAAIRTQRVDGCVGSHIIMLHGDYCIMRNLFNDMFDMSLSSISNYTLNTSHMCKICVCILYILYIIYIYIYISSRFLYI